MTCRRILAALFSAFMVMGSLYAETTPEQMAAFNQAITDEVQKANSKAAQAVNELGKSDNVSISETARLNMLVNMAQVKRTLAGNLLNTPSMNNADVRNLFLSIMQQDIIEEQDLLRLQTLINSVNAQSVAPTGATGAATFSLSPTGATAPVDSTTSTGATGATAPAQ